MVQEPDVDGNCRFWNKVCRSDAIKHSSRITRTVKSAIQNSRSWLSSVILLLLLAGGWFAQPAKGALAAGEARLSALILSGDGSHDWRTTTGFLRKLLTDSGRFEVRVNESPAGLTARTLAGFDVVVNDYSGPRLGTEADKALEAFVRAGKGLVVTHGGLVPPAREPGGSRQGLANLTTASWPASPTARDEVPFQLFDLRTVRSEHPVMQGLESPLRTADMPRRGFTLLGNSTNQSAL